MLLGSAETDLLGRFLVFSSNNFLLIGAMKYAKLCVQNFQECQVEVQLVGFYFYFFPFCKCIVKEIWFTFSSCLINVCIKSWVLELLCLSSCMFVTHLKIHSNSLFQKFSQLWNFLVEFKDLCIPQTVKKWLAFSEWLPQCRLSLQALKPTPP